MIPFKTTLAEGYFITVPENADLIQIAKAKGRSHLIFWHNEDVHSIKLPPGQYRILGLASQLTEEQAGEVVEKIKNYIIETQYWEYLFDNALDSLVSMLRSHNLNPETTLIIIKQVK